MVRFDGSGLFFVLTPLLLLILLSGVVVVSLLLPLGWWDLMDVGCFFCIDTPVSIDLIEWSGCGQFAITIESIVYSYVLCCTLVTPIIVLSDGVTLSVSFHYLGQWIRTTRCFWMSTRPSPIFWRILCL